MNPETIEIEMKVKGVREMKGKFREIERRTRRAVRGMRRFLAVVAETNPDLNIRLYAACRVKVDPMVPLRFKGARMSVLARGWSCDVGLYSPVHVSFEEVFPGG